MEENVRSPFVEGRITDIRFSIATDEEIRTSSISEGPIYHASQLTNPFLGLPLESGKCESCGTAEPGKCEGHFGYIELPIPIYHPNHVTELKKLLILVCLKCLRLKRGKNVGSDKSSNKPCLYCPEVPQIGINETKTTDGVVLLELKLAGRSPPGNGFWDFMDRYGYHYGGEGKSRTLLPCEVLEILKKIPEDTRKRLSGKAYFTQDGYILQKLPVPPNCLSIPDISDGVSIMSSDISVSMLRKVLKQVEIIKSSRSGRPNFESHRVEVNDLQSAVAQYLRARGTAKDSRDIKMRSGTNKEADDSATKAWLEKMKTYFISKGSGYCSRSVITGDAYKKVNEIGLPLEVAQKITFEEKVTECNKVHLQELVDRKLCLTYRDGASLYSLREGSKGHTLLKVGQVVHRRIMDGDVVFINRPPSTHKHSLQALSVYVHEDHTVKINPLICGPLDADFDGDCVHLFYPQSLAARAEVLELFSVEQQLLSSHSGSLNLQLKNDSLLSLKVMFKNFFLDKVTAQQLAMSISTSLPQPALLKVKSFESKWTVLQILQTVLPDQLDCVGERYCISQSEMLRIDFNKDMLQSMFHDIISSVFFNKGPKEALNLLNSLQPLLMESLFSEGYSLSLKDFSMPKSILEYLPKNIQDASPLLPQLRSTYNKLVELQVGNYLRSVKEPVVNFILKLSGLGNLIDTKSESAINKVVEQIGFLGLQLADKGKFYSRNLVEDMTSLFLRKYAVHGVEFPSEAFGLIKSSFFHGLNPYEDLVHSISSREVLVRSSRGLTEPGTLFKNLMTILRDVVVCYDGTVRNVSSNSVIQFEYGVEAGMNSHRFYPAGEPVGALAATAISNPAYKAVLDSSSSSNASWELMKEVLVCKVNFVNDLNDRRVVLYLNDCGCGKKHCKENAAYIVQNQLKKVSLRDISVDFLIEYQRPQTSVETDTSLVGHIHLDKRRLKDLDRSMHDVLLKCQENISLFRRKKKSLLVDFLKNTRLSVSDCCSQTYDSEWFQVPCMQFSCRLDTNGLSLETTSQIMANMICPIILDTIIKGDRRVCTANIIWISPDTTSWVKNQCRTHHGEVAVEIVLEKKFTKKHGDAWRLALDSCLPVIHLIDPRRSIPYAIRQVQEVLGISCAFDQAVQRLSTSIRMVNKGVLKEHLILAANSMTCTGSLIGFNKGGYRALFRSLNVQIPFTEATLFTPRKCFEKAAEKCHTDTLSGIVASCSWGKHVSVGSGTHFEILWNKKEMGLDQNSVIDIYNFLQLVRRSSNGESNTSCLGEDYDDLEIENRVADPSFSPEPNSEYCKPTFDDGELQCEFEQDQTEDKGKPGESNWEKGISVVKSGGSSDAWEKETGWNTTEAQKSQSMDAWGSTSGRDTTESSKLPCKEAVDNWGKGTGGPEAGWNTTESQKSPSKKPVDDTWGKQTGESETSGWDTNSSSQHGQWNKSHESHTTKASQESSPKAAGWNTAESQKLPSKEPVDSWGKEDSSTAGWNSNESQKLPSKEPVDAWGKQTDTSGWETNSSSQHGRESHSIKASQESPTAAGWNIMETQKQGHSNDWENRNGQTVNSNANEYEKASAESSRCGDWNSLNPQDISQMEPCGTSDRKIEETKPSINAKELCFDTWGKETKSSSEWSQHEQVNQPPSSTRWTGANGDEEKRDLPGDDAWGNKSESWSEKGQTQNGWGKKASSEWSQQATSSLGWGSPSETQDEQERNLPWGRGKKQSGRGWGSSDPGDWKLKNRPARSPGRFDDRNARGNFTPTRSRIDQFTPEEQKVYSELESIIQSLRRILHQSGKNDGDPLAPEDQSYVLDNVFNYHPDKAVKMGAGVDYVMVSKHSNFQETRCFYIVSTDGRKEDFSYRKCLENFVKEKFPELAHSFNPKYFKKPRSREASEQPTPPPAEQRVQTPIPV